MAGPAPAVAAARSAVRACLADLAQDGRDPADAGAPDGAAPLVLVAVSGGADSLALAAATAFVAPRAGLRAGAVVVDHGLQEGSAQVCAGAAAACAALGLGPVEVVRVRVEGPGGVEAAARDARYAALDEAAGRAGARATLLGHTLDDQAEGVLLGLARGSGARSLAGMPAARGALRRPFLGLRRADTEAVCAALGLEPWHDPTNGPAPGTASARLPLRSRVRHEVLPVLEDVLGPGVAQALARTAAQLRDDADALEALADEAFVTVRRRAPGPMPGPGTLALDADGLSGLPRAVRRRVLRRAAIAAGCPAGDLSAGHVETLERLVLAWHGQGPAHLPGARRAHRRCGTLVIGPAT
ncbi:tRNA lysidine(34) synthetase TilS [Cellulomonas sp. PhB143]|uniref:tRNA lysidine(34) synthetase TilS n=1 Tax=Cellulomonas sp. PhB143 TaxID=2485186 RepID=UPI000F4A519F|nr:tRNA lysidine(34) synthetase TilS [Cellulomonas sp. PhB143]ROS78828.1 tRNA(Ile)-lysidine synthase [Cellulomonas sp. PhB143]